MAAKKAGSKKFNPYLSHEINRARNLEVNNKSYDNVAYNVNIKE